LEQFVAILGASELTYMEARKSQNEQDWIRANEGALHYFGGNTSALIPDNTRTAVSRSDPYEPGLNQAFDDFALHYGLVILPTRVRRPRDKAFLEGAARLVYQRISARLRGKVFFSLAQVNAAIRNFWKSTIAAPSAAFPIAGGNYSSGRRPTPCVLCPHSPSC
jgi:transposase